MSSFGPESQRTVGGSLTALTYPAAARLLQSLPPESAVSEETIPGFVMDRPLGSGGSGHVYRAFRAGSDQPVAIKLLRPPLGSGPALERVWREIDLLSSLRLPCVARFLEHGTHDGRMYLVTEFIDGNPLSELVFRRPTESSEFAATIAHLSFKERTAALVDLLARLAEVVQSIHERGVLHRDLKPANIIVTPQGDPVLVDFGLATLVDHHLPTLTSEGAPLGTPAFMPPEQARGDRASLSTRSDVWSLGATACWLLTGHTPFDTDCSQHELLRRIALDQPREPRALSPELPRPLAAVLSKATAREPVARYASAAEFAADLRRFARGEPVTALEPSVWLRLARWIGRHPVAATTAASVVAAATILLGSTTLASKIIAGRMSEPAFFRLLGQDSSWHQAILVSRAGNDLKTLANPSAGDLVRLASLVPWPDELSGQRSGMLVAAIMVATTDPSAGTRSQVWVCDPKDLSSPLFAGPAIHTPPTSPDGYADFAPQPLSIQRVIEADVYPDVPGPEFIVLGDLRDQQSANLIFVQDLRGNVLFEAWHFGHLADAEWWPEHRVLIAIGDRHGQQTHQWAQLDHPEAQLVAQVGVSYPYPRVVLAVRVGIPGRHGWLGDSRDASPADSSRPLAWYKALWPPRGTPMFNGEVSRPVGAIGAKQLDLLWKCNTDEFPARRAPDHALTPTEVAHSMAWWTWAPTAIRWEGNWVMQIDDQGHVLGPSANRPDGWKRSFVDGEAGARRVEASFTLVDFPSGLPRHTPRDP